MQTASSSSRARLGGSFQATAREAGEKEGRRLGGTAASWPCSAVAEGSFLPSQGVRSNSSSMPRVAKAAFTGPGEGWRVGDNASLGSKQQWQGKQTGALWPVGLSLSITPCTPPPGAAQMLQMSMQSLSSSSSSSPSSSSESLSREDSWLEVSTTSRAGWQRLSFFTLAADWAERIADCSGRRNGGGQLLVQSPPPSIRNGPFDLQRTSAAHLVGLVPGTALLYRGWVGKPAATPWFGRRGPFSATSLSTTLSLGQPRLPQ